MQFSWTIFTVVLLLGMLQLVAGVVFGRYLPLGRKKAEQPRRDVALESRPGRLRLFFRRSFELLTRVSQDVDRHHAEIAQVNDELSATPPCDGPEMPESVLKTVSQILEINERLQIRLSDAEVRLKDQAEQMESHVAQARTDALTGLPNRRAFDDEMARRISEWRRKSSTFCMMIIDIDHFKRLNDRYGHPAGDYVLRHVAEVLETMLREMDLIARIGGEEFALVLPSTGAADARRATERIRSAIASELFHFEQQEIRLTISIGLARVAPQDDVVALLKRADEALYAAKAGGRNCGYFHDGRVCTRIGLSSHGNDDPSSTDLPADGAAFPKNAETSELTTICDQLRDRLAKMVDEP
ncbi:MAG: GGDEF domain-containing protein [Candidatus Nealsonbacteria bacterium]|nr:GGDEF domain-containing protein [Candidatus Nealsonbacteria bacterium]